jgi:hypothetical protein
MKVELMMGKVVVDGSFSFYLLCLVNKKGGVVVLEMRDDAHCARPTGTSTGRILGISILNLVSIVAEWLSASFNGPVASNVGLNGELTSACFN